MLPDWDPLGHGVPVVPLVRLFENVGPGRTANLLERDGLACRRIRPAQLPVRLRPASEFLSPLATARELRQNLRRATTPDNYEILFLYELNPR